MPLASASLLRIFGIDESAAPANAELEFSFTNLPQSGAVFVFIGGILALIWLSFWLYRREKSEAGKWSRRALAFVRVAVFTVLFLVLLGPAMTYTQSLSRQPVIALLRDASHSMATVDEFQDEDARAAAASLVSNPETTTRSELVDVALLGEDAQVLQAIAKKGRVRYLDFGSSVTNAEVAEADDTEGNSADEEAMRLPSPLEPKSPITDLASAIEEGLRDKLTSAVVLVTDGQHNSAESVDGAIADAAKRGVPVFAAGVGDPVKPQNITVTELYADPQVWKGDPFEVQAKIFAQGLEGEEATAQLVRFSDPAESAETDLLEDGEVLDETSVLLPEDGAPTPLIFTHQSSNPGTSFLGIRILPLEAESTAIDNAPQQPIAVEVLDDRAKVLLVSGTASWEFRALTRFLLREETIDLSTWLQGIDIEMPQRGNSLIRTLPSSRDSLFQYDVVLLLDPSPLDFSAEWIELLEEFVESHAGGLLYMPGPIYSGSFLRDPRTADITGLLPVDLGDVGDMEVAALLASNTREWPLEVLPSNLDHPLMRFFADREQNEAIWSELPGVYWSFPAQSERPGARTLIEHSDPSLRVDEDARPLVVSGYFGGGRTVFLGIDGTWRWRTAGDDAEFFHRFWVQAIRYLAEGRALAGKRRGSIEADRSRYLIGDRVQLTARLRQATFEPWKAESVPASLSVPGRDPTDLSFSPVPNDPGTFQANITADEIGEYKVTITLEDGDAITFDTRFRAELPIRESRDTWLDEELLTRLTEETGGKYFRINELDELVSALPNRIRRLETRSQPIPLWDTNRILFLLVGLLGIEWALRKRMKML
ncbi:MAG: VWA domain-containing protein [Verrucomicrobiota bacterium]